MPSRLYYSARTGRYLAARLDLPALKRLFLAFYWDLCNAEQFQEMLGKDCPEIQTPSVLPGGDADA